MNRLLRTLFGISRSDLTGMEGASLRLTGIPENFWILFGLLAVFGVLCWLVVHCYRREGKTPMRVQMTLAGIRLALLVLLFFIALQPALVIRFVETHTSAVVVLVDDSLSMRWQDRYVDDTQRAALADALGIDASVLAGDRRPSRTDLVRRALEKEGGVLSKLAADHALLLYRFGVTVRDSSAYTEPVATVDLAEQLARGKSGPADPAVTELVREGLDELAAGGHHTHLGRGVREVLNRLEGRRLAAVVVVSDGQNTGVARESGRLTGAIRMAQHRGVPVYCVSVGDPVPPRNIAVTQLQGPREARENSKISFTAFVTERSLPKQTLEVRLLRSRLGTGDWEDTGAAETLTVGGIDSRGTGDKDGTRLQEVMLTTEAPEVGVYVYKARIEPLNDEMIHSDNEAGTIVRVTDQKLAVLLVAGDAGWEFQYLRNYLLRAKDHYDVTVWQQNADARFNQDASTGMKRTSLPATRDELFLYDVIILCDPRYAADSMDAAFVEMLGEFTGKHHGGVCYIAGNKFTAETLDVGGGLEPLGGLLPVVLAEADSGLPAQLQVAKHASPIQVTPAGLAHPMMQIVSKSSENTDLWKRFPGIYRSQGVARLKTLATALAVSGDATRITRDQQREPIMAVQYYGKGRVLYMGFDSTWRWRMLDRAVHYERFWGNALDFLGAGRLEKKRILVTTGGEVFDAGAEIRVRAEAYNRDFTPMDGKTLTLEMRSIASTNATAHLLRREKPGFYTGLVPADRTGVFELDVTADAAGQADWLPEDVSVRRIEIRLPQEEFQRPEADTETLHRLAGKPDRFVPLHEIESLADRIPLAKQAIPTEVPHTLWNTFFMLGLLGLLLLTEWTVRKVYHMM